MFLSRYNYRLNLLSKYIFFLSIFHKIRLSVNKTVLPFNGAYGDKRRYGHKQNP